MSGLKSSIAKTLKKESWNSAPAPKPASKVYKSARTVRDSDDEEEISNQSTIETKATNAQKPLRDIWRTKKLGGGEEQAAVPTKAIQKHKVSSSNNEEESDDTHSTSGEEVPSRTKRLMSSTSNGPSKANGALKPTIKTTAPTVDKTERKSERKSSSESESDNSESEDDEELKQKDSRKEPNVEPRSPKAVSSTTARPAQKPSKVVHDGRLKETQNAADGIESGRDSSNNDSEEGESESEAQSSSEESNDSPSNRKRNTAAPTTEPPVMLPYAPPSGFNAVSLTSNSSSNLLELFPASSLQGKQLWHIVAPVSVPISSVTQVTKQSVAQGTSVLSHNGAEYGLVRGNDNDQELILLPSVDGNTYEPSGISINRTLRLQQIIHPGNSLPNTATADRSLYSKPALEQPEGLKMRYKPFGTSESDDLGSDETGKENRFRVPQGVRTLSPAKKRKRDHALEPSEITSREPSPKKSRKSGLPPESGVDGRVSSQHKDSPRKHLPSHRNKDSSAVRPRSNVGIPGTQSNHDRDLDLINARPLPSSRQSTEVKPVANGVSPAKNDIGDEGPLKQKEKRRKKRHESQSGPTLDEDSPQKVAHSQQNRTDHDRDATAGARSPEKEVKEAKLKDHGGDIRNMSKHRDETPEERARRRAEKRRKKEMKMKGLMDG